MQIGFGLVGDSTLSVGVSVKSLSLCVGPAKRWRPVHCVPFLLSNVSSPHDPQRISSIDNVYLNQWVTLLCQPGNLL